MPPRIVVASIVALLFSCAGARTPAAATAPAEPTPEMQLPRDVRPTRYALQMEIVPEQERFRGTAEIAIHLDQPRRVLWLHGRDLHVTEASAQFESSEKLTARYQQLTPEGVVRLTLPREIGPGAATLRFAWDRHFDPKLIGLYLAHEGDAAYAFTMFEPVDARRAFPGFDEPAFKTPFEVTLIVPEGDEAIANTVPKGPAEKLPGGMKRIHYSETKPLPTYLVAWAVGPFDVVEGAPLPPNALRSWPVPVRGIAPKGRGKELAYALKVGNEIILGEEQYFGIPFPYEKLDHVAVPDFAYGAEENAGEIHYREQALLFEEGKSSEDLRTEIAGIMSHEMSHQWFGDLVTMRWWDDTWLNESFATWMGHRSVEVWNPQMQSAIDMLKGVNGAMNNDALVSARAIRQPMRAIKDVWDQFDGITYQKGGGVLGMIERYVGAEPFREGVSAYLKAHAHGWGSTDDLLAAFEAAAGREVVKPFHTFLDQAGVPLLEAKVSCAPGGARVDLKQSRYLPLGSKGDRKRLWQIPVCARFSAGGREGEKCALLSQPEGALDLGATCPDWVLPNADGAGYYRWALTGDDLRKLQGAGYPRLSVRERISLSQSLRAAVRSGALPAADALAASEAIARDPEGAVAGDAYWMIDFVREHLAPPEQRPLVDAYLRKLYRGAYQRLGWTPAVREKPDQRRFRAQVIDLLAYARDPEVRREAQKRGLAYAGLADGKFHPEAVDADLAETALGVAVEDGGEEIFGALEARLGKLDDAEVRGRILNALGSARDPKRTARALSLSLDPRLRTNERLTPLWKEASDYRTVAQTWLFVQEHFDAMVPRLSETQAAAFVYLPAFCETARIAEMEAFFGPRAEKVPGMPLNLAQALEQQRICVAQAQAQRESARKFFALAETR